MIQCPKCGKQNEDGAVFCATCGSTLYANPIPTPTPVQNDNYQPYTPMPAPAPAPSGSNPGLIWLILNSVFSFFYLVLAFCTCITVINLIPGIIGIVFGGMSVSKFKSGRVDESRANAKLSMIMFIVGAGLAALMIIGGIILYLILGASILSQLPNYNYFN